MIAGSVSPLLLSSDDTGYNLTRSVRSRSSASAYWSRTNKSTVTSNNIWTWCGWRKLGTLTNSNAIVLYGTGSPGTADECTIKFTNNQLEVINYVGSTVQARRITNAVKRDPAHWYQICVSSNGASGLSIEFNGLLETSFATSVGPSAAAWALNTASVAVRMGAPLGGTFQYFDGFQAEDIFVDGQALSASNFGSINALTGVWQPARYTGTYGLNGGYWSYTDNSALTTSSNVGLGKDFSGNGNYWTTNNISITAGVTYDSMTDVPTLTSATAANYCTWNPLLNSSYTTLSNGNLTGFGNTSTDSGLNVGTIGVSSGKWYWEITVQSLNSTSSAFPGLGFLCNIPANGNVIEPAVSTTLGLKYRPNGIITKNSAVVVGTYATFTTSDVISFALDVGSLTCGVYKNNTLQTTVTGLTLNNQFFAASVAYDGSRQSANFGQQPFAYTPPSGFLSLNTFNLPDSTIVKGSDNMNIALAAGASIKSTTEALFSGQFLEWIKDRANVNNHQLLNGVTGLSAVLQSNTTAAEATYTAPSGNSVGFAWKAGSSSASNTNGTITSTVSVNAAAGFSVVTYTGTGATATVGHGLGVAPAFIISKNRGSGAWYCYHSSLGASKYIPLNTTDAATTDTAFWNNTTPSSTVFSMSNGANNNSAATYVDYCWTPIAGYSAMGSYVANGSADGVFVYLGFRPKFLLLKESSASSNAWFILDATRDPYNVAPDYLQPNTSIAESAYSSPGGIDFLSNGFKLRTSSTSINTSGSTIIYAAFAENPFRNSLAR